ncbi:solute carrier family 22 member 23 isoform X4 [Ovis aries]|uniref:solute carrier family 22 member 23 isoform X4 n=1 Tax=Ovis aries TaxID=9940 RepID=UPI001C2E3EB9|nr:solute carrier family 22 member 23 isoform X4 [Ovis aries]
MAIDRRREAAGGGPGRLPPAAEENGALPPGDAAASAPLGGRAGPGGGGDIQPLPAPHAAGGPHPSLLLLDYDGSVLPFLGGLGGGYQKTLVLLTWIPALFIGFSQFSDSFLLDQPNFWCRGAGKGAESAGVTATGRWDGGDLANGTSPPTTLFPAAPWGTAGPLGNGSGSGADGGEAPPLPSPPDKGDNASNCDCHAWDYGIRTGLVQNVVSKGLPTSVPQTSTSSQISSSTKLVIKGPMNATHLSHPQTIPLAPGCGKLSSTKSVPGVKKAGDHWVIQARIASTHVKLPGREELQAVRVWRGLGGA